MTDHPRKNIGLRRRRREQGRGAASRGVPEAAPPRQLLSAPAGAVKRPFASFIVNCLAMVLFVRPRGALNSPCLRFPARADNEKWDILGSIETECSGSLTEDAFVAGALLVFHNFYQI